MSIDVSRLDIEVRDEAQWRRTLAITIPADIVTAERRKIAKTLARQVRIPGFRAGKIPPSVIEKRFGPALDREMVDKVVGDAYKEALDSQELRPISEGEIQKLDFEPEQDLAFEISFDVEPTYEFSRLTGFSVTRPATQVGDEEVDRVVERLREQQGSWVPVEEGRPEAGDLVSLTATQLNDEGEDELEPHDYDLQLGQGDAIEDVESAVYTLEVGQEGEFEVTFPDDFPNEERRGLSQKLRLKLRERKVRELPELDDDFARSVGEFEDLEALTSRIREDLEKEANDQAEGAVRGQLLDAIIDANPFDVPGSMVDRYIDSVLGQAGQGQVDPNDERMQVVREQFRPEAERAVKRMLVIEKVAEAKELAATEDDVDDRIEKIAEANDTSASEVYGRFQKSGRLEQIERELTEQKVFEYLKSESEIVDGA